MVSFITKIKVFITTMNTLERSRFKYFGSVFNMVKVFVFSCFFFFLVFINIENNYFCNTNEFVHFSHNTVQA